MDKIISFIIPSYNVEQYLEKCLSSFLNPQAIEQMEVIIVDDGSKDRTARIAGDYVKQYPELFRSQRKTADMVPRSMRERQQLSGDI
jgi:glycosyltransferase involved in cell wall biosynthesis